MAKLAEAALVLWAFAKVGVLGFGGGASFVTLIRIVAVDNGWVSTEEFGDVFALGNALPGPIGTKLAGYIGYRAAGWPGALAGVTGMALPSLVAMIVLFAAYRQYRGLPAIEGMIRAIRPVVVVLLVQLVLDLFPAAVRSDVTAVIGLSSLLLILYLRVDPIWVIVGALAFGAVFIR